ncbi:MAG: trypsin-like peptidase domain-containing protein [Pontiellaceae bacterium]|nr:trypsin-like peptidase domain-containing protein [Pontiellaceae bacterium]MBN2784070.1 trypsin-like peptidase domain-containing protein [Pontiellaceae bacterium]
MPKQFINDRALRKLIVILSVLLLSIHSLAEEKPEKSQEQQQKEIKEQFTYSFDDVSHNLVIIECETCIGKTSGSGFIAKADGKTYVFTNQHVIMGADSVSLTTVTGDEIKPKSIELSVERDIARLEIEDRDSALEISKEISMEIPAAVFGNSEGSGVATALYGTVKNVTSELVEVTAEFVAGNSGSPVLNLAGEVIGIASYVQFSAPSEDDDENTKNGFEKKTRRFCYRLTDVKFAPVNWRFYNEKYGKPYLSTQNTVETMATIIGGCLEKPLDRVPTDGYHDISLVTWANTHNRMIDKFKENHRRQQLFDNFYASVHKLSGVAHRMSLSVEEQSKERSLTGFLRDELESSAYGLEYAAQILEYVGQKVAEKK